MATVELQAAVTLPPAAVYEALIDLHRKPEFDPTIVSLTPPDAEAAEGAIFTGVGLLSGTEENFEALITGLEPSTSLAIGYSFSTGARLLEQWNLRAVPSGTLISYRAQLSLPGGLFGRLLDAVLVGGGFRKQREAVLAQTKAVLDWG